jgi:hypothetical protein
MHADSILGNPGNHMPLLRPKESTLDSALLCEEVLDPIAQKLESNPKITRKPFPMIPRDSAQVHMARVTQDKLDVSRVKRMQ